jgi:hypothetical protein
MLSLASCSSDDKDGDWDPMVWKAEVPVVKTTDGIYEVSADGATFTFSCRNYSRPWIEQAASGDRYFLPDREKGDFHTITADWFRAEVVGNKLTVSFEPNKKPTEQSLSLTVTAGDIFYTFKFKQFAQSH